jgi:hypothetical protein
MNFPYSSLAIQTFSRVFAYLKRQSYEQRYDFAYLNLISLNFTSLENIYNGD